PSPAGATSTGDSPQVNQATGGEGTTVNTAQTGVNGEGSGNTVNQNPVTNTQTPRNNTEAGTNPFSAEQYKTEVDKLTLLPADIKNAYLEKAMGSLKNATQRQNNGYLKNKSDLVKSLRKSNNLKAAYLVQYFEPLHNNGLQHPGVSIVSDGQGNVTLKANNQEFNYQKKEISEMKKLANFNNKYFNNLRS
ncbi:MAG TPA: hypothetical protein PLQ36_04180, partial [Candidatus Gracilibacteria bacterium]|nr:hypothetical protein [Candidatus Gracilibacteria bacterium]